MKDRKPGRPRNGEPVLSLHRIVVAAWEIVDRDGMTGLSTRSLAAALNVKSPALYWHVRSKKELLSRMIEHLLQQGVDEGLTEGWWTDSLKQIASRQRELLLAHRDSALIASLAPPSERLRSEVFPRMMAPLLAEGIAPHEASAAAGGLASLVMGWVLYEQRAETREFIEAYHSSNEGFEFALNSFVRGIALNVRQQSAD